MYDGRIFYIIPGSAESGVLNLAEKRDVLYLDCNSKGALDREMDFTFWNRADISISNGV